MHELFIFSKCKALFLYFYDYYLLEYHFISAYLEEAIACSFKTELSSGLHVFSSSRVSQDFTAGLLRT